MNRTVYAKITNAYYDLTGAEKKIADYVLANRITVQFMSITELAREAGVSEASISRFCRTLAFGSFNAFKLDLAKVSGSTPAPAPEQTDADGAPTIPTALLSEYDTMLRRTRDLLNLSDVEAAVDIIQSARKVCCMGQGGSLITAQEAWSVFSNVSSRFICVQDSHLQSATAALLGKRDAILYFSYSGATRAALDVLPMVHENGVKVILITRYRLSPAANFADVVLLCGADESPMQLGSVAARISQLYLVDVLYTSLCRRDPKRTSQNREQISRALNIKHM